MLSITEKQLDLLPPLAREFVNVLREHYDDAHVTAQASAGRLGKQDLAIAANSKTQYIDGVRGNDGREAALEKLTRDREYLAERNAKNRAAFQAVAGTFANITKFLTVRAGALKPAPRLRDAALPTPSPRQSLASVRAEIAALAQERHLLTQAAPTAAEQEAAIRSQVETLATAGAPRIAPHGGVSFGQQNALALQAWLDPDSLTERLIALIDIEKAGTLDKAAKAARLAEIDAEVFQLERVEEAIIRLSPGQHRRKDANVYAVLSIVDETAEQAAAREAEETAAAEAVEEAAAEQIAAAAASAAHPDSRAAAAYRVANQAARQRQQQSNGGNWDASST